MLRSEFNIQESRDPDGVLRLAVVGELDLQTGPVLARRLNMLRGEQAALRLDLSGLEFIDCTGGRVVLQAASDAQDDGRRFELGASVPSHARRLLQLLDAPRFTD